MWVAFVVGSISTLFREIFLWVLWFSLLLKNRHFQFQLDQESGKWRTTNMWMCYLQMVFFLNFIYSFGSQIHLLFPWTYPKSKRLSGTLQACIVNLRDKYEGNLLHYPLDRLWFILWICSTIYLLSTLKAWSIIHLPILNSFLYNSLDTDCCTRQCCGPSRPFDMKILDNLQREVIHLSRPLRCSSCWFPCCLQEIEVQSPPGTILGYCTQSWDKVLV